MEQLGHEVFIFAPDGGVVRGRLPEDSHIIRLPAFQYDLQMSLFSPVSLLRRIKALKLDIIQFYTPAQVGLLAAWAAHHTGAVLVGKHSTDTYEYCRRYAAMSAGYVFGGFLAPFVLKPSRHNVHEYAKLYLTPRRRGSNERWTQRLVAGLMALLYSSCDAVVAVSRKSADQLLGFAARHKLSLNMHVIPDGVDTLPPPASGAIDAFRAKWGIEEDDQVVVNFGRMAEEKNQVILIRMMPLLLESHPKAKLLLAGDFVYRGKLEQMAARSTARDRIIFSGRYEREEISTIAAVSEVFAFPSVEDTQGFVLNEAAGLGLPIVMCDHELNDVFVDGRDGLLAENSPRDFAAKVAQLFDDDALRARFGANGIELAKQFSERHQTEQMLALYEELLEEVNRECASV